MSHHKYHTEALVIGVTPQGEGDLRLVLVTRELGVVRCSARGARLQKSKNRMSLVEGTQVRASLVKGKDMWRLTNVMFVESFWNELSKEIAKQKIAWSIHLLLRKIVPHDVLPSDLYDIMFGLWQTLREVKVEQARSAECIALLNIVHELGYLGEDPRFQEFLGVYYPDHGLLDKMEAQISEATETINNSLKASHL